MTTEQSSNTSRISKWTIPFLIIGFVIVIAFVFYFVFEGTKNDITIVNAGAKMESRTHAATVGEALKESDIKVREHDQVSPVKSTPIKDGMKINYIPANSVTIMDTGKKMQIWSTKKTVKEVLKDKNIKLSPHDVLNVGLSDKVKNGLQIDITRAIQLSLENGNKKENVWTTKKTVGDLLSEKKIHLTKDDRISPTKNVRLTKNMNVQVIYVDKKTETKTETVAFDTIYRNDANLEKGNEKVISKGEAGKRKVTYEKVIENGKQVKNNRISDELMTKPKNKIVARGTKTTQTNYSVQPVSSEASVNGERSFVVEATAYSGGGITATGINLSANPGAKVISVDPRVIPLGSRVFVEGYGEAIAGDTGGAIKGNIIDVYFPNESSCYSWGRRSVKITIL
ncbi:G5 and 3D domain-containing protein [Listeria sp. PSOL-1]|uniref:G5 and 3D domain-containing protein n=1 Tax=Listeria sp. PSOL-1 TaxID=1844999 RepID=UPI0013D4132C|nr:G5 and 3D domain-containing protein [Listeria sp. PSOL-1]